MGKEYLLGEADEELSRLGFQHEVWAATTSALWDRARFGCDETIADLGSGPGFASLPLSRRVREGGKIISVDASAKSLSTLSKSAEALGVSNIETRHGMVDEIELGDSSLDGVFARWLFCFLSDAAPLVAKIARWLRPGGRVAILDYFRYETLALAPPVEVMPRIIKAVSASWSAAGGDLDVGGRLPMLLAEAGLELEDVRPIVHCARPGTAVWDWPRSFFEGYLDGLVEKSLLSAEDAHAFRDALRGHAKTPGAFMLTPPVIAIVARKN